MRAKLVVPSSAAALTWFGEVLCITVSVEYHITRFILDYSGSISGCIVQEMRNISFSIMSWVFLLLCYCVEGWHKIAVHIVGTVSKITHYLFNPTLALIWYWR